MTSTWNYEKSIFVYGNGFSDDSYLWLNSRYFRMFPISLSKIITSCFHDIAWIEFLPKRSESRWYVLLISWTAFLSLVFATNNIWKYLYRQYCTTYLISWILWNEKLVSFSMYFYFQTLFHQQWEIDQVLGVQICQNI